MTIEEMMRRITHASAETRERAVERMLTTPGDYGARLYEWTDLDGYHAVVQLTHEVEHMTIDSMPVGTKPTES